MELATLQDFEERHGPGDDKVEPLLRDAAGLIADAIQGAPALWVSDPSAEVPDAVVGVCIAVAYRAWSNPDALSSEALGAHTQAWADRSGEALRLTKAEERIVRRAATRSTFQSATLISPYSGDSAKNDLLE